MVGHQLRCVWSQHQQPGHAVCQKRPGAVDPDSLPARQPVHLPSDLGDCVCIGIHGCITGNQTNMCVFLIFYINTHFLQLYYLNRGVQLCDTIILVPLNFCSFNVSCLFNGLVYYNQWERLFYWQVLAVLFGIVLLVYGVLVISLQPSALTSTSSDSNSTLSITPSDYSQPFLKTDSLDEEDGICGTTWWTRMKLIYRKSDCQKPHTSSEPDEHTGLLTSI